MGELNIPILADIKKEIMNAYGAQLNDGSAVRASVIIDPKQTIRHLIFVETGVGNFCTTSASLVEHF